MYTVHSVLSLTSWKRVWRHLHTVSATASGNRKSALGDKSWLTISLLKSKHSIQQRDIQLVGVLERKKVLIQSVWKQCIYTYVYTRKVTKETRNVFESVFKTLRFPSAKMLSQCGQEAETERKQCVFKRQRISVDVA